MNKSAKVATVAIFLALIRCISEPFRLQYYAKTTLTLVDIKPYLVGSLVAAIALFAITILSFYGRHKLIVPICIITVVMLIVVKATYHLQ